MEQKAPEAQAWLTPQQALDIVKTVRGEQFASRLLLDRLRGGKLVAYAMGGGSLTVDGGKPEFVDQTGPIPTELWAHLESEAFWVTGDVTFIREERSLYTATTVTQYFDLRFKVADIEQMFPALTPKPVVKPISRPDPAPTITAPNKGGRPRKDYWDDLWVEMCRQVFAGTVGPASKQADIEKAMLSWAAANGHDDLSEQSARTRARALLAALKKEDKN